MSDPITIETNVDYRYVRRNLNPSAKQDNMFRKDPTLKNYSHRTGGYKFDFAIDGSFAIDASDF